MLELNVKFFNPDELITLSGWMRQTSRDNTTREKASVLGPDGDEVASRLLEEQHNITVPLVSTALTGNLALPKLGQIINGYHVDGFTLTYNQGGFPQIEINAHKHGDSDHDTCRTYTPSITAPAGFGIPSSFGSFSIGDTVGMRGLTYSCSVNHVDENKGNGDHLAGDNYDGTEQVSIETTGVTTITAPTGWTCDSDEINRSNVAAETHSASFSHHLTHDSQSSS